MLQFKKRLLAAYGRGLRLTVLLLMIVLGMAGRNAATAQALLQPWGNLEGIRIDGQLMEFGSSLRLVKNDWADILMTWKERQRPKYDRKGDTQVVTTDLDRVVFTERVVNVGRGAAVVHVQAELKGVVMAGAKDEPKDKVKDDAREDAKEAGAGEDAYVCISLDQAIYGKGSLQADGGKPVSLAVAANISTPVSSLKLTTGAARPAGSAQKGAVNPEMSLLLHFEEPTALVIRREGEGADARIVVYIPVSKGKSLKDGPAMKSFAITVAGPVDRSPVNLSLDPKTEGRAFDGFGGNFRLQNPLTDPKVIQYCLDNLRVAWGRVEMPWRFWQPKKSDSPIDTAENGGLAIQVQHAMEMARRLSKLGMPVILTAWSAPAWAVVGEPRWRPGPDGVWGNPLEQANIQEIYKSIADYIVYMKKAYGVEVSYFSFNESDLGINIRQTGEEHAALIKGLGAYFVKRGLKTKLLLGDNSDATTYTFIDAAMRDTATYPYIGLVSFHSWRGWDAATLQKWADAAVRMQRPLIVGEGSIDAQASGYPAIFEESSYALEEINLYVRLLNICQPASILQWQLTADYSPLAGGGIFGNNGPLHPTQRFWNFKQLASTPAGLKHIGAVSDKKSVTIAALGNAATGGYSIHIVNQGAERTAKISGLPPSVSTLRIFITDKDRAMKEDAVIPVKEGKASVVLGAGTYTTLSAGN